MRRQSKARRPGLIWSRFHFLIRFLGVTGLFVACVGLFLARLDNHLASWQAAADAVRSPGLAMGLVLGGATAAIPALLVEIITGLWAASARRSLFGLNAVLQVVLAAALLVGVNFFAFEHPLRFDWTRSHEFTLPDSVQTDLRRLNDETTVVIYQRHKSAGDQAGKMDRYDFAAERKVVEKVKDLVQQLREIGPRFRVETLDVEEGGYDDKLDRLTRDSLKLREAIEAAPENTLFFQSKGRVQGEDHVQAMSFDEFCRLEKVDSEAAGNLVLGYAGVRPIVDRIFNLEERRPRVGVLVVHELLTTDSAIDLYTLAGLKKSLNAHGFDVRDIVLKRWAEALTPAVDRLDDSKLDRLLDERDALDDKIKQHTSELDVLKQLVADWPTGRPDDLAARLAQYADAYDPSIFVLLKTDDIHVTAANRQRLLDRLHSNLAFAEEINDLDRRQRESVVKELTGLKEEDIRERRRMTDLRAKLDNELAECDLLLIPRQTILSNGTPIVKGLPEVHDLNADQAAAIKEFMCRGKPVFACFGPRNQPGLGATPPDDVEKLFADLGVHLGKKTVLFNAQVRAFAESDENPFRLSKSVEVPPLHLDTDESEDAAKSLPPNPIRESLLLTAHSTGRPFDLTVRYPRPVYLDNDVWQTLKFDPDVLTADRASWNDAKPFRTLERPIPSYSPPDRKDPDNATPEATRRGPFTVAVAFETDVPARWQLSAADQPAKLRIAAVGHGGLFIGKELSPSQEGLLLDTCNWLLGRDDRLARPAVEWRYPRVAMSGYEETLWLWGARLGLPLLFAYLGAVALLLRRLR
jgi:hypothetical protein